MIFKTLVQKVMLYSAETWILCREQATVLLHRLVFGGRQQVSQ